MTVPSGGEGFGSEIAVKRDNLLVTILDQLILKSRLDGNLNFWLVDSHVASVKYADSLLHNQI